METDGRPQEDHDRTLKADHCPSRTEALE